MESDLAATSRLIDVVPMGGAVCLLGAGFSVEAKDQQGMPVPGSTQLVAEIKKAFGISEKEDLSLTDVADYCESDASRQRKLRSLLTSRLTLCEASRPQVMLAEQPWRSIFTTNFDDTVERCFSTPRLQVITPTKNPSAHLPGRTPLYYLHGRAADLNESDVDPRFVISERNYLQLRADNIALYTRLKNELFSANLIVVVGYSLRDLDIARLFMDAGQTFRQKTVLVCHPEETEFSVARLQKFGQVLPIGVTGFADLLKSLEVREKTQSRDFQFVHELEPVAPEGEIVRDDTVNLILSGSFSRAKYQAQVQSDVNSNGLYCVRRSSISSLITDSSSSNVSRFIISSDFGNGKTIFLAQLAEELITAGFRVIRIASNLLEVFDELTIALKYPPPVAFVVDDVIRYRKVAEFIGSRLLPPNLLVCAMRGDLGEVVARDAANFLGGEYRHLDLNRYSDLELQAWDQLLERWGFWEDRISRGSQDRIKFLSKDCGAENRSLVLALFRNSYIAGKIDTIVAFFLRENRRHERAFAALLTASLCQQHVSWESLVSWLNIDEDRLRRDIIASNISSLFVNGREWNSLTSPQLAEYILRTRFVAADRDILVDVYSTIVLSTADSAGDDRLGHEFRENLKELMKFRFLTRLFGEDEAAARLIGTVYRRLSNAHRIRKNPQFWLQFAMSCVEAENLTDAESYLKNALGLARERGQDYSPHQILDQRARLYLRKNSTPAEAFSAAEIRQAVKDLQSNLDRADLEIIYLFRSLPLIAAFLELHLDTLSQKLKADFRTLIEGIQTKGARFSTLPKSQKGETAVLRDALREALLLLSVG